MHEGDRHAALADGGGDALHGAEPYVAAGEDPRDAGLEQVGIAVALPPTGGGHVGAGQHVAVVVERDLGREPRRLGVRADQDEEAAGREPGRLPGLGAPDVDRLERRVAVCGHDLGPPQHLHVRARGDLVDEVARHALLEPLAAADDRDAPGVVREEHRRLPGGVARSDDVHVEAVRARRLAAHGAVGDSLPGQPVEALHLELPPRDAARQDDCPGPQDVAVVEVHLAGGGVDPRDRACHEDLRAEPAGLLQRPAGELLARYPRREAEVVLDPGRRAGLAAGRLALDHDGSQALRRAVDGCRQAGRPGADDHGVVLGRGRLGGESQELGHAAQPGSHHRLAVDDAQHGAIVALRQRALPMVGRVRRAGLEPAERDLISIQEVPELRA